MFDCGIHPGFSGLNSLPYLDGNDDVDISKVDVALITHFHLDHCAAVPYLLSKTKFKVGSGGPSDAPSCPCCNRAWSSHSVSTRISHPCTSLPF
jgi:glyoxylase-like metal-dependent hydrolase (beta-lactamase superfamily II)